VNSSDGRVSLDPDDERRYFEPRLTYVQIIVGDDVQKVRKSNSSGSCAPRVHGAASTHTSIKDFRGNNSGMMTIASLKGFRTMVGVDAMHIASFRHFLFARCLYERMMFGMINAGCRERI
jgi:hypothetical protein